MESPKWNVKHSEYLNSAFEGNINFSATSSLKYYELSRSQGSDNFERGEGSLDDEALAPWLVLGHPSSEKSLGCLRLLYGQCSFEKQSGRYLPLSRLSFGFICSHLGIPSSFLTIIANRGSRAYKHTSQDLNGTARTCYIFKFGLAAYTSQHLAITYNYQTCTTSALLLGDATLSSGTQASSSLILDILQDVISTCTLFSHPMFLPSRIADSVFISNNKQINVCDQSLCSLEEVLGQHEYGYGNCKRQDPLTADLVEALRKLNAIARALAGEALRLGCLLMTVDKMREFARIIGQGREPIETSGEEQSSFDELEMEEYLAYLKNAGQVILARIDFMKMRKDSLLQVVYQFMTQKNANVNIELARDTSILARASKEDSEVIRIIAIESKKDGTSMKTIAILGMIFLPGTFLATIFAMPVFNWEHDSRDISVFKPNFKYYWAICVPLTVTVILTWMLTTGLPWKRWLARVSSDVLVQKGN